MSFIQTWTLCISCRDCLASIVSKLELWFGFIYSFDFYVSKHWDRRGKYYFILLVRGQNVSCFVGLVWKGVLYYGLGISPEYTNKSYSLLTFSPLCTWLYQVCLTSSTWHFTLILLLYIYWVLTSCKHSRRYQLHRVPPQ